MNRLMRCLGALLGVGLLGCAGGVVDTDSNTGEGGSIECGSGISLCGDQCVHTPTDASHCGVCFNQCDPGLLCSDGACVMPGAGSGPGAGGSGTGGSGTGGSGTGGSGTGGSGTGGSGGSGGAVSGTVHILDYQVVDAEYDAPLDKIILVSTAPNALHIHDPFTNTESIVPLQIIPTSVSVAPDGMHAAVGHNGWVSYVDLASASVVSTLSVTTNALDVVLAGNGYAYVFPKQDQWENIRCINLGTGVETLGQGSSIYAGTVAKLHPNGTAMYGADNGLSPSDIERYGIANGTAQYQYDSPYHGDFSMCGDLWISEDGARIFTRCGNVFKASDDKAQDMTYAGSLDMTSSIRHLTHSSKSGKIAAIPMSSFGGPADADTAVHFYDEQFLQFEKSVPLPFFDTGGGSYATHGQFVFVSSDGAWTFAVIKVDPAAGALKDFGIATL